MRARNVQIAGPFAVPLSRDFSNNGGSGQVARVAGMGDQLKKYRILLDAARLIGAKELARRLNVPEKLVADWIRGDATISDSRLLKLSEVLQRWANESQGA